MEELIEIITNNGIGVACVLYLIYFQSTTMREILNTLGLINTRLLKIENKLDIEEEDEKNGN